MLTAYIVSAIVAGVLILVSALGAHHDTGAGHDSDFGSHDIVPGGHGDADHGIEHELGAWVPFFSIRFWTYFAAAFGLIGLLLTGLNVATDTTALILAIVGGLATGLSVAYTMRWFRRVSATTSASAADLLGKEARVLVGLRQAQLGKVRVEAKGELIDLLATAEGDKEIEVGEQVVVISIDGNQAKVARKQDYLDE